MINLSDHSDCGVSADFPMNKNNLRKGFLIERSFYDNLSAGSFGFPKRRFTASGETALSPDQRLYVYNRFSAQCVCVESICIEMQLTHYDYLPERFLHQICRVYSKSIPKGEDYSGLPPVIHIAIVDCNLFPNGDPRNTDDFISQYYMTETKNHQIYSGNFHMDVVSLKNIENAEEKEDPNGIYQWAKLFKAVTWEKFNMIAENNSYMESIATSVCALCNDPKFVEECERRMRNEWDYNSRMAEADRKGMARGMERGMAQGMERGMAQGMERGMVQGKAESIIELLEDLGDISQNLQGSIMDQRDLEVLRKWHKLAAKAQSVEDFCAKTGLNDF